MTNEIIEDFRNIVKPYVQNQLLKYNYEGMGEADYEEFGRHFDEILDLALIGMQGNSDEDCISRKTVNTLIDELARAISDERCCISRGRDTATIMQEILDLPSVQPKTEIDVLDKIRAEIHATAEMHEDGDYYLRDEWIDEIISKYKAESEDKG